MSAPKPPAIIAAELRKALSIQSYYHGDFDEGVIAQAVWDALLAEGEDRTGPEMYAIRSGRRVLVTEVDAS